LISDQWVLSAAHCSNTLDGPAKFAKLGNVTRNRENHSTWTYKIIQRVPHPNYNSRQAEDDIALFKLDSIVQLNRFVIPLCLPQVDRLTTKRAIASGWGREGFGEDVSETLMKVTIEYFDQTRCNQVYDDDEKLDGKGINWSKMVCAGSTNKTGDTCNVNLALKS
jgi:secreted trypsin-like serine protease